MDYQSCWNDSQNAQMADQIIQEINVLRKNPKVYLDLLESYIEGFEDDCIFFSGSHIGTLLDEGKSVLLDAQKFLKSQQGLLKEMKGNHFLKNAAKDHYVDIASKGLYSHKSSDGKRTYKERIEKYCMWGGSIFEAILYGEKPSARDVVLSWIIDDGFKSRTHRINLLNKDHVEVGIICGPHSGCGFCYIAVFAAQTISKEMHKSLEEKKREQQAIEYRKQVMQNKNWGKFAQEVFELQNKVRANPKVFIGHLEKCLGRFQGNTLYSADKRSFIETKEGNIAYVEAIEFLRIQKAMKAFKWHDCLAKASQDHIDDIGPKGMVSNIGSNGSLPTDRISKYGAIDETWGESNIFGGLDAKEVIERLLVCDGQPTRGFRKSLFNDQLNYCGIATGPHSSYDNMIQLTYVKQLLGQGEVPTITVQVTEDIPQELVQKFEKMGIAQDKLKIIKDNRPTHQAVESLIGQKVDPNKLRHQQTLPLKLKQSQVTRGTAPAVTRPKSASNAAKKSSVFQRSTTTQVSSPVKKMSTTIRDKKPPTPLKQTPIKQLGQRQSLYSPNKTASYQKLRPVFNKSNTPSIQLSLPTKQQAPTPQRTPIKATQPLGRRSQQERRSSSKIGLGSSFANTMSLKIPDSIDTTPQIAHENVLGGIESYLQDRKKKSILDLERDNILKMTEDDAIYKSYEAKSNQKELVQEKNLIQLETKELTDTIEDNTDFDALMRDDDETCNLQQETFEKSFQLTTKSTQEIEIVKTKQRRTRSSRKTPQKYGMEQQKKPLVESQPCHQRRVSLKEYQSRQSAKQQNNFDLENDPDRPKNAINSSVIIEEIDINGKIQKVYKKTYQLVNGLTKTITRIDQI